MGATTGGKKKENTIYGALTIDNILTLNTVNGATVDTDKFVVIDGGVLKYRTGTQIKSDIGLSNVENTALTTWTGNTSISSVGTITTGVWSGTALVAGKVPNHDALTGFVANEHLDWTLNVGTIHTGNYVNTTYTSGDFTHDSLSGVDANEHLDWTTDRGATNIHANNYTNTTYLGGTGITLSSTTFNHTNSVTAGTATGTGTKTLTYGEAFNIPTVTYDAQGHVTGKGVTTLTLPASDEQNTWRPVTAGGNTLTTSETLAFTAGTNITISEVGGAVTINSAFTNTTYTAGTALDLVGTVFSHEDTSSQASVNGSGRTYIQDVTLDAMGHVTGLATATETVTDTTYVSSDFTHDSLSGVDANEHIDWTLSSQGTIHSTNYTNSNTQNVFTSSWIDSGANALLRLTKSGASSGTQDITIVAGSGVSLTPTTASSLTIANTSPNTVTNITVVEAPTLVNINSSDGGDDSIAAANGTNAGVMTTTMYDNHILNNAKISFDSTSSTRLANTSGTNTGDNATNTQYSGLVSNATHSGEVTGATALTLGKTSISNRTAVTPVGTDYLLIGDTSDSNNLKKVLVSNLSSVIGGVLIVDAYDGLGFDDTTTPGTTTITLETFDLDTLTSLNANHYIIVGDPVAGDNSKILPSNIALSEFDDDLSYLPLSGGTMTGAISTAWDVNLTGAGSIKSSVGGGFQLAGSGDLQFTSTSSGGLEFKSGSSGAIVMSGSGGISVGAGSITTTNGDITATNGDIVLGGDLRHSGTNLLVFNKGITLNASGGASAGADATIYVERGTSGSDTQLGWLEDDDAWGVSIDNNNGPHFITSGPKYSVIASIEQGGTETTDDGNVSYTATGPAQGQITMTLAKAITGTASITATPISSSACMATVVQTSTTVVDIYTWDTSGSALDVDINVQIFWS